MGELTNTRLSDSDPDPDGDLKTTVRIKIRHYRNLYLNRPDPIAFIPLTVYDDFVRLLFLNDHRNLVWLMIFRRNQISFRSVCFTNLKGPVGLIMTKTSGMRISIPLDLSSRSFIPLSRTRQRYEAAHAECSFWPFIGFCTHHSFRVTPSFPWPTIFFIPLKINTRKWTQ